MLPRKFVNLRRQMVHSRAYSCQNVVVFCLWDPERGISGSATAFISSGATDIVM